MDAGRRQRKDTAEQHWSHVGGLGSDSAAVGTLLDMPALACDLGWLGGWREDHSVLEPCQGYQSLALALWLSE